MTWQCPYCSTITDPKDAMIRTCETCIGQGYPTIFIWDDYSRAHLHKQNELHKINAKIDRLAEHAKRLKAYDPKTNDERSRKAMLMIKIVMHAKVWVTEFQKLSPQIITREGVKGTIIKPNFKK